MRCLGAVFTRCWRKKILGLHLEIQALMEHIFYIVCLAASQSSHTTFIHYHYHNYEHKMVCMHTSFPK
jgi:hypothetical protein